MTQEESKPKHPGGRPTDYRPEYCDIVFKFSLLGASDLEIANFLGVSESTLYDWKERYPKFLQAIKEGKVEADANVAERLYNRARGYDHEGKHYPADTAAAFIWLKNRRGKQWKDRQELTGADGKPIEITNVSEDDRLLLDELKERLRQTRLERKEVKELELKGEKDGV